MIVKDRLYGNVRTKSGVITDLIQSTPVQRLKGIAQFGIPDNYYHVKNFSRYEHSVGVMLLLKRLGATEEEQVAGLLHDVSHTAFSHTIDWVVGDGDTEDFQDIQHESFVKRSEIPKILRKFGYSAERVIDYQHFGLLEKELPDLCADRIDYSLREFPTSVVKLCVPALSVADGRIVFKNKRAALIFSRNYLKKQLDHWGGFEAVSRYRIFANMLRRALSEKIIDEADFWQNDNYLINKLKRSNDKKIQGVLRLLENKSLTHLPKSNIVAYKKFRYVDPFIIFKGELVRLSDIDKDFYTELKDARMINQLGTRVPLVKI